jgi:hypothetical protein
VRQNKKEYWEREENVAISLIKEKRINENKGEEGGEIIG